MKDTSSKIAANVILIKEKIIPIIEQRLVDKIEVDNTISSRAYIYIQCCFRSNIELLKGICISAENNLATPCALSARAFLEAVAAFTSFHNDLEKLEKVEEKNYQQAHDVISKHLLATRNPKYIESSSGPYVATNIKTKIPKLNKYNPNAASDYGWLSNICHPNYEGLCELYAAYPKKEPCIDFCQTKKQLEVILSCTAEIVKDNGKVFFNLFNSILCLIKKIDESIDK